MIAMFCLLYVSQLMHFDWNQKMTNTTVDYAVFIIGCHVDELFCFCSIVGDCCLLYHITVIFIELALLGDDGGGQWHVSPDGVAPSQIVGVSASVNLPLHHKVQKFSSGTG